MLIASNRTGRKRFEICLRLTKNTPERHQFFWEVNIEKLKQQKPILCTCSFNHYNNYYKYSYSPNLY